MFLNITKEVYFLCEEAERQFLHGCMDFYSIVIFLLRTPQQDKSMFKTIQKCHINLMC